MLTYPIMDFVLLYNYMLISFHGFLVLNKVDILLL